MSFSLNVENCGIPKEKELQSRVDTLVTALNTEANTHRVFAAGIHTWAGGADTTDSIAVTGLLDTDVIQIQAAVGPAIVTAIKGATAVIDLVVASNATNGTSKYHYVVYRANP